MPRWAAFPLRVSMRLNDLIEYVTVLVDSAPQPVFFVGDADDELVQMPNVVQARLLAAKAPGISGSELPASPPDRLIGRDDAALEQHLLDEPEAQGKSEVQPDRMGDDLRRKAMAFVADGLAHARVLKP